MSAKAKKYESATKLFREARAAAKRGDMAAAARLRGQAYSKLGYQPNPKGKGSKTELKKKVVTEIKKADDPKEKAAEVREEAKDLKEAATEAKAEAKEAEVELKEATAEAKADPTAENLEAKAEAEAKVEAKKTEAEQLTEAAQVLTEAVKEATGSGGASSSSAESQNKEGPMNKKKRANGFYGAYRKAQNAGDKAKMRAASANLRELGYRVTKSGLVEIGKEEKAAPKKAAPKKAATKKAATKKAAPKKAATKKAAPKKAATKKAAAKQTAGKTSKSRKSPGFPAAPKGSKVMGKAATTTYKSKSGQVVTKTVTRVYRTNPMGEVGMVATMLLFGIVGAVGSDVLDRYVATMPVEGSDKPLSGIEASVAIARRPDGKRLGAQGAVFALLAGLTYLLNKKNKRTASIITGALMLGVVIRTALQALNGHAMPKVFASSKDAANPSIGDRLYSGEQDAGQSDLDSIMSAYSARLRATSRTASEHTETTTAGPGAKLAGISARLGGRPVAPSTTQTEQRPARIVAPAAPPAALPAATSAVPRLAAAPSTVGRSPAEQEHVKEGEHSKLGCGGPSCGPACGCEACKAQWGNNPLSVLFTPPRANPNNQGSAQTPTSGARPVPQLGAPVVQLGGFMRKSQPRKFATVGFRG